MKNGMHSLQARMTLGGTAIGLASSLCTADAKGQMIDVTGLQGLVLLALSLIAPCLWVHVLNCCFSFALTV